MFSEHECKVCIHVHFSAHKSKVCIHVQNNLIPQIVWTRPFQGGNRLCLYGYYVLCFQLLFTWLYLSIVVPAMLFRTLPCYFCLLLNFSAILFEQDILFPVSTHWNSLNKCTWCLSISCQEPPSDVNTLKIGQFLLLILMSIALETTHDSSFAHVLPRTELSDMPYARKFFFLNSAVSVITRNTTTFK